MAEPVRIVPIPCPFGLTGGVIHVYYIDAPQPAIVDTGVAGSPAAVIEPALAAAGFHLSDVRWILATHGHWDHIGGAQTARERAHHDVQVALHPADADLLRERQAHVRGYQGVRFRFIDDPAGFAAHRAMLFENLSGELAADRDLADGERIDLGGGVTITAVHTPGHSPGSTTFLYEGPNWAFTGDSVQGGGAFGVFPLIEVPNAYRESVRRLRDDVRPARMFLGHQFGRPSGGLFEPVLEGDAVATILRESLEIDGRLTGAAALIEPPAGGQDSAERFKPAAAALGYQTDDPRSWPSSFFTTLCGYLG